MKALFACPPLSCLFGSIVRYAITDLLGKMFHKGDQPVKDWPQVCLGNES